MLRRVSKMYTRLVSSRFTAKWIIRGYKDFVSYFENGRPLGSGAFEMQVNEAKCTFDMYPHGKGEDDRDSISVDVKFLDDTFLLVGKIKVTLFNGDVPITEIEKDVQVVGAKCVAFDSILQSDETINDLMMICEMYGEFRIDECEEYDVTEESDDCDEPERSNVFPPLR